MALPLPGTRLHLYDGGLVTFYDWVPDLKTDIPTHRRYQSWKAWLDHRLRTSAVPSLTDLLYVALESETDAERWLQTLFALSESIFTAGLWEGVHHADAIEVVPNHPSSPPPPTDTKGGAFRRTKS